MFDIFQVWQDLTYLLFATAFTLVGGLVIFFGVLERLKSKAYDTRVVDILASEENQRSSNKKQPKKESGKEKWIAFLFLFCFGSAFLAAGIFTGYDFVHLKANGLYADAIVVENKRYKDNDGHVSYNAVVRFSDFNGKVHRLEDGVSYGSSPSYEVDTRLGVFYDAENPERFVIDDYWHYMLSAIIFCGIGILLLLGLLFFARSVFFSISEEDALADHDGGRARTYKRYVFTAIVEYRDKQGERKVEKTAWDCYSVLAMMPGRRRTLYKSDDPNDHLRPQSYVVIFLGIVFLCPGLYFIKMVVDDGVSFATLIVLAGILCFLGFKAVRFISKIPKGEWDKGWADLRKNGIRVTSTSVARGGGEVLEPHQIRRFATKHVKIAHLTMVCFAVACAGFCYAAYYNGHRTFDFMQRAVSVQGKVVSLNSRYSDGSYTYYAEIEYLDKKGEAVRFSDSVGASHPLFKRGENVAILYDPEKSTKAIVDRGLFNWTLTAVLGGVAFFCFLIAVYNFKLVRSVRLGVSSGRI